MSPAELSQLAIDVQKLPYRWPAPPDAASTEIAGAGTCAGKHALLAERLEATGLESVPLLVVGLLAPSIWPDLVAEARGILEVHECLTVLTPWAGPLIVDITWHPTAVTAGMPGIDPDWDGATDTPTAVTPLGPGYAMNRSGLRDAKERLRSRIYDPEQRGLRDRVLAEVARRANEFEPH